VEFINAGAQYKVYRASPERVRKIPNTAAEALGVMAAWYAADDPVHAELPAIAAHSVETTQASSSRMRQLLSEFPELTSYVANPTFAPDGSYDQDASLLLSDALATCTPADAEAIFYKFAHAKLYEWQFGFSDRVFNLTVNNGLDAQGKMLLLDFGEVATEQAHIERHIAEKVWLNRFSYKLGMPADHKPLFARIMDEVVTEENLHLHWRSRYE
jgi:hypothetical protein